MFLKSASNLSRKATCLPIPTFQPHLRAHLMFIRQDQIIQCLLSHARLSGLALDTCNQRRQRRIYPRPRGHKIYPARNLNFSLSCRTRGGTARSKLTVRRTKSIGGNSIDGHNARFYFVCKLNKASKCHFTNPIVRGRISMNRGIGQIGVV